LSSTTTSCETSSSPHDHPTSAGSHGAGIATTGLWLFRLSSSFANPSVAGKLSVPVAALSAELQADFRSS
jgi:hypothetical protein